MAESNTVYSRAQARKAPSTPQLEVHQTLAMQLMQNTICNDGLIVRHRGMVATRTRAEDEAGHELCTRAPFTGGWNTGINTWAKVTTRYAKLKCAGCNTKIRTFCRCNKKLPMCTECYGMHISQCNSTS